MSAGADSRLKDVLRASGKTSPISFSPVIDSYKLHHLQMSTDPCVREQGTFMILGNLPGAIPGNWFAPVPTLL